jgi:hypothetical protein
MLEGFERRQVGVLAAGMRPAIQARTLDERGIERTREFFENYFPAFSHTTRAHFQTTKCNRPISSRSRIDSDYHYRFRFRKDETMQEMVF